MRVPFYDLPAQWRDLDPATETDLLETLRAGRYMLGPEHNAFEAEFAASQGAAHAIAVANGTDALRIAMQALDIRPGDEVITTAFTFVASVETILQLGAVPVFVDLDPATFMIDPALIEAAITPKTRAILPIHLFGQMAPMPEIMAIAERHGLLVIEDAAQAVDVTQHGRPAGSLGHASGFSFYPTKNLGAAGDAGLITTNDEEVARRCRSIRIHGMGRERYAYDELGFTSRLDEIQALILRRKMRLMPRWNARRREVGARYLAEMTGVTLPAIVPGVEPTWHQFAIRTDRREALQAHLKEREIDTMIYYPVPLHLHAPYAHLAAPGSLPETERVSREVICLPCNPHLSDDQVSHVIASVSSFG